MKVLALLVGINKYPGCPLKGCVNDVVITRDILVKKYMVPAPNIRMVIDERATKSEIMARLEWLATSDADIKLFWYSGHGAQYPNQNYAVDNEIDGQDELICPVDFNWRGNWINDDTFTEFFTKCRVGKTIAVFDCCHSGTMHRDQMISTDYLPNPKIIPTPRVIPTPLDILSRDGNIALSASLGLDDLDSLFSEKEKEIIPVTGIKLVNTTPENLVMITGCQDEQTSADAFISGRYQGALSYHLQKHLMSTPSIGYKELFTRASATLKAANFEQTPNLVCTDFQFSVPFLK